MVAAGMVKSGDVIVSVDGTDCCGLDLKGITRLLQVLDICIRCCGSGACGLANYFTKCRLLDCAYETAHIPTSCR